MLASFDMATVRILHVVFFEATLYACRLIARDNSTLARRLYLRLTERLKTDEPAKLRRRCSTPTTGSSVQLSVPRSPSS